MRKPDSPSIAEFRTALREHFDHDTFRDGQQEVITSLMTGRSSLAVFPTGGGKSLCYQLPALLLDGITLVVSPLIALMKDQVDALQSKNLPAARLDSTLSAEETHALYQDLDEGKIKILYIAPERLANEKFRHRLETHTISLLAIDEAHCISEWGHNFRPDYLKLTRFAKDLKVERVLCLTATATPKVSHDICNHFQITKDDNHQLTFYRPNLHLSVTPLADNDRKNHLLKKLQHAPAQSTIVYCTLQFGAESLASFLNKNGITARPYHAGLRPEVRSEIQEQFMSGETPVICATIAFGMGIDKANIRAIYHYNLPKSLENYTQEIGRAGRDGETAHCELLACRDDLRVLANFTYGDTPQADALRSILRLLLDQSGEFDISIYELSRAHDIRPLVINTLLTYLEIDGYLVATAPFYASYKVRFNRSRERLLAGCGPHQKALLEILFPPAKNDNWWREIDPDEISRASGKTRKEISQLLTELETLGDLIVKPSKVRQGYRLLKKPDSLADLTNRLIQLFQQRETSDLARLTEVVDHALSTRCLYQSLLSHFGEELEPCGHCSRCRGDSPPDDLPVSESPEPSSEDLAVIQELIHQKHPGLRSPRQLARFLCGMTSPATSYYWYLPEGGRKKQRITNHDAYALLETYHFQDVLSHCESLIIP